MLSILATITAVFADVVNESSGNGGVIVVSSLVGIIIGGLIGGLIGNTKNRVGLGVLLGAILGCIGWIIVAIIPRKD